jgi:hypothetical protein
MPAGFTWPLLKIPQKHHDPVIKGEYFFPTLGIV